LQALAARAFDRGIGRDGEAERERKIEKRHAKIGQLTVKSAADSGARFFRHEVRQMSASDRRGLIARGAALSIRRQCAPPGVARCSGGARRLPGAASGQQ
jgi:hypothetical protein